MLHMPLAIGDRPSQARMIVNDLPAARPWSCRSRRLPDFSHIQIVKFEGRVAEFGQSCGKFSDLGSTRVLHRGLVRLKLDDVQIIARTIPVGGDRGSARRGWPPVIQFLLDVAPEGLDLVGSGRLKFNDLNESHHNAPI
jgi:hypothetical protein